MEDEVTQPSRAVTKTLKESDIVSRPLPARRSFLTAIGGTVVAAVTAGIAGCATRPSDRDPSDPAGGGSARASDKDPSDPAGGRRKREPGLYWYGNVGFGCYDSGCGDQNLKALVGLPVDWSAKASCEGGSWNFQYAEIASGALPPGLKIGTNSQGFTAIVGVPERAGTWHLQVRFVGVTCANMTYGNKIQTLHITTEGSSAPRSVR